MKSMSNPPYTEYPWDEVNWDDPTPDDVVALHELTCAVHHDMIQWVVANDLDLADVPSAAQTKWDRIIVKVGIGHGPVVVPEDYEYYSRLDFAGSLVREDRLVSSFSDEELEQYNEERRRMHDLVTEVLEMPEVTQLIEQYNEKVVTRKSEIEDLNKLFYEEEQ